MSQLEIELTLRRIGELEEEIRKLRERVAVLESRPGPLIVGPAPAVPPVFVPWPPQTPDPYAPPFTVTCGSVPAAKAGKGGDHE